MSTPTSPPPAPAPAPDGAPAGRPGRYQRSVNGLVGAMIILVLFVLVFIGFRGIVRDNPDAPPLRAVAYGQVVRPAAEQTGWQVVAPQSLPPGWTATSVRWQGPPGAYWHLGMLTDSEDYVGIEQAVATPRTLVQEYVGEGSARDGSVRLPAPGTGEVVWERWTDPSDGDLGLVTTIDDQTLLVVTSLEERRLSSFLGSLALQG